MKYKRHKFNGLILENIGDIPLSLYWYYCDEHQPELMKISENINTLGYNIGIMRTSVVINKLRTLYMDNEESLSEFIKRLSTLNIKELEQMIDKFIEVNCTDEFNKRIDEIYDYIYSKPRNIK